MQKIDKGIPIPTRTGKGRHMKYPFEKMEVGDSFALELVKKNSILGCATSWAKRNNPKRKFSIRHENGITRIWRIK